MTKLTSLKVLVFLLLTGSLERMVDGKLEQVMDQTYTWQSGNSQEFHGGLCQVTMKARGPLVVLKGEKKKLMWQTGLPPGHIRGDIYELQLRDRGNMVIERIVSSDDDGPTESSDDGPMDYDPMGAVTVYDTHTEGYFSDYFLGINDDCVLEIREGTVYMPGGLVWTNIKTEKMEEGDSLGVSEIYLDNWDGCDIHFMFMSPDGNLEVYEGKDFADAGDKPVWESGTKRQRGDYRFIIGENATLSLLDVATGEQYWKKVLQNPGRPPSSIDWLSLISFGCEIRDNGFGPYQWFFNEGNVFMKQGERLPAGSAYSSNKCTLFVQHDGRLDVDDNYNLKWSSGKAKDDTASDDYFLMLSDTGNLVMYRKPYFDSPAERLWATHTNGEEGEYFLRTTPKCDLRVYQGTPELRGELVWSNRVTGLEPGDRLIKAQYFAPGFAPGVTCDFFMVLLPDTGMLGIYEGRWSNCMYESFYENPECFEDPVWSFDTGLGEYDDFYMKVGYNGKLKFYGVGEGRDVSMDKQIDLGDIDYYDTFEVGLCSESGLIEPFAIGHDF